MNCMIDDLEHEESERKRQKKKCIGKLKQFHVLMWRTFSGHRLQVVIGSRNVQHVNTVLALCTTQSFIVNRFNFYYFIHP